jgi:integrase/recombinase XerC
MPIDRYLDHLAYEKRCSAHTVLAYRRDLVQFVAFLSGHGGVPIERATDRMIRLWMMQLMEQGTGPRSVNRKLERIEGILPVRKAGWRGDQRAHRIDRPTQDPQTVT